MILKRKSHNCAGTAFVQGDSADRSKLIEQTLNIGVNNLRKPPVLQLKQSNLPLALYLLNEQFVREKHMLGHVPRTQ